MKNNNKKVVIVATTIVIFLSLYFAVTRNRIADDIALSNDAEVAATQVEQPLQHVDELSERPVLQSNDATDSNSAEVDGAVETDVPQERQDNASANSFSNVAASNVSRKTDDQSQRRDAEAPTLSQGVFRVIDEVQQRQLAGQWEEALNEMNALYADFDNLNPFEQVTLLNFLTNTLFELEMYEEAIPAFELMRTIDDLRPDIDARSLLALGQLNAITGDTELALNYYEEYLDFTEGMSGMEQQTERVLQQIAELGAN